MIPEIVETTITIQTQHSERAWYATLPNGRSILAFRPEEDPVISLEAGQRVPARLTVADFSRALLLV